eukprot:3183393-Pyramimonas_sp.AAC.1
MIDDRGIDISMHTHCGARVERVLAYRSLRLSLLAEPTEDCSVVRQEVARNDVRRRARANWAEGVQSVLQL